MSSTIAVDNDTLSRYRQEVLNTVGKWMREGGQGNTTIQMALSSNNTSRRLRRCVLCSSEEPPSDAQQNHQYSQQRRAAGSPSSALSPGSRLPPLDALLQDFYDHGWITYDGLDHCYPCARRLACEILAPHYANTRRESNKTILRKILTVERGDADQQQPGSRSASAGGGGDNAVDKKNNSSSKPWQCPSCGVDNEADITKCSVCETERPPPLVCPYCDQDASVVEFCPNDPTDPMENHLDYHRSDPTLSGCGVGSGGGFGGSTGPAQRMYARAQAMQQQRVQAEAEQAVQRHGRHDVWTCENTRCHTRNLGIIHPDKCRTCEHPRLWFCLNCKNEYRGPSRCCPKCLRGERAGSRAELEERDLCKLSGMSVEEARRQRRANSLLEGAKNRVIKRIERDLGFVNVRAADDGNCLFHALSFQLFRNANLHHLLRLLAVEHIILEKDNFIGFVHGLDPTSSPARRGSVSGGGGGGSNYSVSPQQLQPPPETSQQRQDRIFYDYARKLSMDGTWGDALVLHAIARVFNVQIHIVSGAKESWHNVISPGPGLGDKALVLDNDESKNSNNNSNSSSGLSPTRSDMGTAAAAANRTNVIFVSFIAELHYNSIVATRDDAHDQCLPYKRWIVLGDLNPASVAGGASATASSSASPATTTAAAGRASASNTTTTSSSSNNTTIPALSDSLIEQQMHNSPTSFSNISPAAAGSRTTFSASSPSSAAAAAKTTTISASKPDILNTPIQPNQPFDRVIVYFPDEHGNPGAFLGFNEHGRMHITTATPFFFQRFAAQTPTSTKQAFPNKRGTSFVLLDELGKNVVCTLLPINNIVQPQQGTISAARQQQQSNEVALMPLDLIRRTIDREPRVTVMTSFEDGSCAMGTWMFVVEWSGPRAMIKMEQPSSWAKSPARISFAEESTLHRCQTCGVWYLLRQQGTSHYCQRQ